MSLVRLKDLNWAPGMPDGKAATWEQVHVALLMDIRDRLDVLRCDSFIGIPARLLGIERQLVALRRECRQRVKSKRGRKP